LGHPLTIGIIFNSRTKTKSFNVSTAEVEDEKEIGRREHYIIMMEGQIGVRVSAYKRSRPGKQKSRESPTFAPEDKRGSSFTIQS